MQGVYKIKNNESGKIYIGSSVDIKRRWSLHKSRLGRDAHVNTHLQNSWNKHGKDAFEFAVIEIVTDKDELIPTEQWYLDNWSPEYNILKKAACYPEGRNKKISQALQGNTVPQQVRDKISKTLSGRKLSKEHCRNVSLGMLGREVAEITKRKIGEANRGINNAQSKLNEDLVVAIREMYATGYYRHEDVVEELDLNISPRAVGKLTRGERWEHAGGPIVGVDYSLDFILEKHAEMDWRKGENSPAGVLTEQDVLDIRYLSRDTILTYQEIVDELELPVGKFAVGEIVRGANWPHVGGPIIYKDYYRIDKEGTRQIRELYATGNYSCADVVKELELDLCRQTVGKIVRGERRADHPGPIKGRDY